MKKTNLLLSGATGQSGMLIAKELAASRQTTRIMVRDTTKALTLQQLPGADVMQGDMLVRESLKKVLEGIDRAILISSANDCMVETQCSFIDACKEAGVRHVIKFSGEESQKGYDPQRFRFTREHEQIEDYLESSGLQWTHLRPSQFMQVYLREASVIINTGTLRLPLGRISMSPVDLHDVAKVAALLLAHGGYHSTSLRITGPEALTMADIAAIISDETDTPTAYVPISWEERQEQLEQAELPTYLINAIADQTKERCSNPEAIVDLHTHELFGITATTFKQFIKKNASRFKFHETH